MLLTVTLCALSFLIGFLAKAMDDRRKPTLKPKAMIETNTKVWLATASDLELHAFNYLLIQTWEALRDEIRGRFEAKRSLRHG